MRDGCIDLIWLAEEELVLAGADAGPRSVPLLRVGAPVVSDYGRVGTSERQLHRRTLAAVGYPPKVRARVLRLRRLTRAGGPSMVGRALAAGYASQRTCRTRCAGSRG